MDAVLIPVKHLDGAKGRLAETLTPAARRQLALAMLGDVLQAASAWPLRLIVTSDSEVAAAGDRSGWQVVEDPGTGLNGAVAEGTRVALGLGASALLVMPFDVPLVTGDDLRSLFATAADVVVCRSDDGGTTALLRRPPDAIAPQFGPGSGYRHAGVAAAAGLHVEEIELPGLRLDVDDVADLWRLAATRSTRASAVLARKLLG